MKNTYILLVTFLLFNQIFSQEYNSDVINTINDAFSDYVGEVIEALELEITATTNKDEYKEEYKALEAEIKEYQTEIKDDAKEYKDDNKQDQKDLKQDYKDEYYTKEEYKLLAEMLKADGKGFDVIVSKVIGSMLSKTGSYKKDEFKATNKN